MVARNTPAASLLRHLHGIPLGWLCCPAGVAQHVHTVTVSSTLAARLLDLVRDKLFSCRCQLWPQGRYMNMRGELPVLASIHMCC